MKEELVEVVDENDKIIKTIKREKVAHADIVRVVDVVIQNKKGEILLQLRGENVEYYPSYWDCSGGGHVDPGESYDETAQRELFEETGIKTDLNFLEKRLMELDDGRRNMAAFYKGAYDGKTKLDPNELSDLKHFPKKEIEEMIERGKKVHPECLYVLKKYFL